MEFQIEEGKLQEVIRLVTDRSPEETKAAICADWHEGAEHQEWLDAAPASEIADWILAQD